MTVLISVISTTHFDTQSKTKVTVVEVDGDPQDFQAEIEKIIKAHTAEIETGGFGKITHFQTLTVLYK